MDKRSYSLVLPAAFLHFVLLGFTDGQFFPGKDVFLFTLCVFLDVRLRCSVVLSALVVSCECDSVWIPQRSGGAYGIVTWTHTPLCALQEQHAASYVVMFAHVTLKQPLSQLFQLCVCLWERAGIIG